MRRFLESLFVPSRKDTSAIERINILRAEFSRLKDNELRVAASRVKELHPLIAMAHNAATLRRIRHGRLTTRAQKFRRLLHLTPCNLLKNKE